VLRGGYWYGNARYSHAAYRDAGYPDSRAGNVGFRVVWCPPRPDVNKINKK
jgi:formylglycine-generating enzyme required for sulfatase activity